MFCKLSIRNNLIKKHFSTLNKGYKILFFGSDHFPLPVLKSLYEQHNLNNKFIENIEIVTH